MAYKPIESYGVIGDLHSVALVGTDGAIDWCCLPNFDSPSIFAAILDDEKGGFFRLCADHPGSRKQMYLPETNVLLTRFLSGEGVGEVVDFMPVQEVVADDSMTHRIVRIARAVRGTVHFQLECRPAFDYARQPHEVELLPDGALFTATTVSLRLICENVPIEKSGSAVVARFALKQGESATFILRQKGEGEDNRGGAAIDCAVALRDTTDYWRRWLARCRYRGRWREMVERSALVLKLLTFAPTGAIVASPTCSLPEEIGGVRNWDYRYTWIRDAAFTVYAFLRLGFSEESAHFMDWLEHRAREEERINGPLNIMYGIDGRHDLPEDVLHHLDGYRGSKPVRIGNAASHQLQLDIYGELIDSIYLFDKHARPVSYDLWTQTRRMMDWVAANWELADEGIWEVRGGRQHFVYSKLQCWVALDRGLRMAQRRSLPIDRPRLLAMRDKIYETIMAKGWNAARRTFTQAFGNEAVDAANLMLPLVHFIAPTDPRMLHTIDRIMDELVSDSLVHRYQIGEGAGDGLSGNEGTFSMCTFWLVEALTRAGRLDEARFVFEKMLTYANHLGLYAEEIGPSGEALGNFPQAFTHLGLISAAYNLDRALGAKC